RKPLKGFVDPVPIYRVTGASDLSSWQVRKTRNVSRFVGRLEETALLRRAAEDSRAGGRTVCVAGDAGIGKSRLVHEFVHQLEREGWHLIEAECSPNLQGAPFAALKGLLRSILDSSDDRPTPITDPRGGLTQTLRSALNAVLDLPVSDEQWDGMEPQSRGRAICDASCAVVENLARQQRTVLLIEDLHWVDRASDVVMAAFASLQTPGLLTIVTSRPIGIPDWIARCNAESLALRALDDSSGRAMLDAILGSSPTTADLKARIIRHTANVPLFIEEVCRGFKDSGILKGQWGDLALARPVEELGIPTSIQGVIAVRLDRLPKEERRLLQIAAALGRRAATVTLRDVAALPETVLQGALAALDRTELLIRADDVPGDTFEFRHDMVRQVTYDSMVEATREKIHIRILSALESDEAGREDIARLCYHATRAKHWAKALAYGRSVARKSVARSAFADAISHFEIAMDALDRTPVSREREIEAIDLRIEARMAFMGSGRVAEWLDLGQEAERRANAIDDIERKVAAMTVRSAAQNFYGTPVEAVATGELAVRLAEEWGNLGWLNLAEYGLGQAYFLAGRYRDAERMLGQPCAQLTGPQASAPIGTTVQYMLLMCCMMKSLTHTTLGELHLADQFQRRAQQIADESRRPFDRVAASYSAGMLMLGRGDAAAAAGILEEAFALTQQHGVRLFAPLTACQLGMAWLEQGRVEAARDILASARETAEAIGYKLIELRASIYLGLALARSGDPQAALNMLRQARNTARQQGFDGLEAEALLCEATVTPATTASGTATIIRCLQASIAFAARNEVKPLLLKAENLLAGTLASAEISDSLQDEVHRS
ncbi:MAG TPA: AAA family ATPase, partial [Bradyrhizobium sp.]|nr:AAA family ATPase [Bradyrhizobium sp.]